MIIDFSDQEPLYTIKVYDSKFKHYFAVSDSKPDLCFSGTSIADVLESTGQALEYYNEKDK